MKNTILFILAMILFFSCDNKNQSNVENISVNTATGPGMLMMPVPFALYDSCKKLYESEGSLYDVDGLGRNLRMRITRSALDSLLRMHDSDSVIVHYAEHNGSLSLGFELYSNLKGDIYTLNTTHPKKYTGFHTDTVAYYSADGLLNRIKDQVSTSGIANANTHSVLIPRNELILFLDMADGQANPSRPVTHIKFEFAQMAEEYAQVLSQPGGGLDSKIFKQRIKGQNNYLVFFSIAEHETEVGSSHSVNMDYYDINYLCPIHCPTN